MGLSALASLAVAGCVGVPGPLAPASTRVADSTGEGVAHPQLWPAARSPAELTDTATEAQIDRLLSSMSIAQ
jgi:beta-glucosidase